MTKQLQALFLQEGAAVKNKIRDCFFAGTIALGILLSGLWSVCTFAEAFPMTPQITYSESETCPYEGERLDLSCGASLVMPLAGNGWKKVKENLASGVAGGVKNSSKNLSVMVYAGEVEYPLTLQGIYEYVSSAGYSGVQIVSCNGTEAVQFDSEETSERSLAFPFGGKVVQVTVMAADPSELDQYAEAVFGSAYLGDAAADGAQEKELKEEPTEEPKKEPKEKGTQNHGPLTQQEAEEAIRRYVDENYGLDTVHEYQGWLSFDSREGNTCKYIMRSYTGAYVNFYVDLISGQIHMEERSPVTDTYGPMILSGNAFDYVSAGEASAQESETSHGDLSGEPVKELEAAPMGSSFTADLDGNGSEEQVHLELTQQAGYEGYGTGEYILHAGKKSLKDVGENIENQLYGVKLDGKHLYLIVYEEGPSDDPACHFYRYHHGKLKKAGVICDSPGRLVIEEGKVTGCERCDILDTSYIYKTWVLNKKGVLEEQPQETYVMESASRLWGSDKPHYYAQLLQPLEVYDERDLSGETRILEPQSVYFPETDAKEWVYVKGEKDEGWMYMGEWSYAKGQELFSGLLYAD